MGVVKGDARSLDYMAHVLPCLALEFRFHDCREDAILCCLPGLPCRV